MPRELQERDTYSSRKVNDDRKGKVEPKGKGRRRPTKKRKPAGDSGSDDEDDPDLHVGRRGKRSRTGRVGRTAGKQYPPEIRRLLGKANSLYVQGNIVEASKHLQDVVMQCSSIPEPYALLGLIYQDSKKYERSLVFYKLACTRDPKNLLNHQETARIAGIIGDHTSRLEALKIVSRLRPCDLNVAIQRARCLVELEKPKQALDVYAKAAKRFPRKYNIYLDLAESVECMNPQQHLFVHQALASCLRRVMGKRYLEPDIRDLANGFASRLREIKLESPKPKRLPPRPMGVPSRRMYDVATKATELLVSKLMESHKRQEPQYEIAVQVVEGLVTWLGSCRRKTAREGATSRRGAGSAGTGTGGDKQEGKEEDADGSEDEEADSDSDLQDSNDDDDSEVDQSDPEEPGSSDEEESQDDEGEEDDETWDPSDSFTVDPVIMVRYGLCQLQCGTTEKAAEAFAFLHNEKAEGPYGDMMLDIAKVYGENDYVAESVPFLRQVAQSRHARRRLAGTQLGAAWAAQGKYELAADAYIAVLAERPMHAAALAGLGESAYWRGKAAVPSALEVMTPVIQKMAEFPAYATSEPAGDEDEEGEEAVGFQKLQLLLQWATLCRMDDRAVEYASVALPLLTVALGQMDQRQEHALKEVVSGGHGEGSENTGVDKRRTERNDPSEKEDEEWQERTASRTGGDRARTAPWKPMPVSPLLPERSWQAGFPGRISSLTLKLAGTMHLVAQVGRRAIFWLAVELIRVLAELDVPEDVAVVAGACLKQASFLRSTEKEDFQTVVKRESVSVLRSMPGGSPVLGPASRETILRGPIRSGEAERDPTLDITWEDYLPPPWRCVEEKDDDGMPRRPGRGWRPSKNSSSSGGVRRSRAKGLMEAAEEENEGDPICTIVCALSRTPGNDAVWNLLQRVAMEQGVDAGDGGFHGEKVEALIARHKDWPQGLLYRGHDASLWNRSKHALRLYSQALALRPDEPLPILCLGTQIARMITVMENMVERDGICDMQALACIHRYAELRRRRGSQVRDAEGPGDPSTPSIPPIPEAVLEQETFYNLGRVYHQLGFEEFAIEFYRRALRLEDERGRELRDWHGGEGVTKEVAHNLCMLYKRTGSTALALSILKKYLTIG